MVGAKTMQSVPSQAMTFTLPGFDQWSFQIVFFGSLLVLEALHGDQTLSTVLEPLDSTAMRAHELINHPRCVLLSAAGAGMSSRVALA